MKNNNFENQRIAKRFVERYVKMLATDMVEKVVLNDCEFADAIYEATAYTEKELYQLYKDDYSDGEEKTRDEAIEYMQQEIAPSKEVYEWWFVDSYLAKELEKQGEVIIYYFNQPLWGRQCTGQAIYLDNIISEIATKN